MDDEVITKAIDRLRTEKQRRIAEKIEKGLAVRVPPLVVGYPEAIDAVRAREVTRLRAAGETREIIFGDDEIEVIVTGVPRRGRDCDDPDDPAAQVHTPRYL